MPDFFTGTLATSTYHAKPADNTSTYELDVLVSVVDFSPPQTVYVV